MRLHVGLTVHDLAFRFQISTSTVSSIFSTWIRWMRLELAHLIIWPSKQVTRAHLPKCFQKHYPKVWCIIDCTEVFIETPSSLEIQALCWSDYKHHTTTKFLVCITPTGMISYICITLLWWERTRQVYCSQMWFPELRWVLWSNLGRSWIQDQGGPYDVSSLISHTTKH